MKDDLVNDTISRTAALDALADYIHHVDKIIAAGQLSADDCMYIAKSVLGEDKLPPAQPGWIPVTDRLPTKNNFYLVWMPFTPEGHHITVAEWRDSYWNIKTPIMAWMSLPLPPPWEGE